MNLHANALLKKWQDELDGILCDINSLNNTQDIVHFAALNAEALRLSRCITELLTLVYND